MNEPTVHPRAVRDPDVPRILRDRARHAPPVRPLAPPAWRAAFAIVVGIGTAAVAYAILGRRPDATDLGGLPLWGAALLRVLAGGWLIALAVREGIPSEGASSRARAAALLVAPLLLIGSAEWLARAAGAEGVGRIERVACFPTSILIALPATGLVAWLLGRAYPLRPVFAAACGALGAGLLADAAMHATCPSADRAHTLLVHGGAIVVLALTAIATVGRHLARRHRE